MNMEQTTQDLHSIAARLRLLGSPSPDVDESKLVNASTIAEDLLAATSSFPPRAGDPPLPVLAHYCRTAIEWTASCILKLKPPPASTAQSSPSAEAQRRAYLARALQLWQLLRLLLEDDPGDRRGKAAGNAIGGGGNGGGIKRSSVAALALAGSPTCSIPGSVLASAAACLRIALPPQPEGIKPGPAPTVAVVAGLKPSADDGTATPAVDASLPVVAQLCRFVRCSLMVLVSGDAGAAAGGSGGVGVGGGVMMRPSLEQCVALLTVLLDIRPRKGQYGTGSGAGTGAAGGDDPDGAGAGCKQHGKKGRATTAAPSQAAAAAHGGSGSGSACSDGAAAESVLAPVVMAEWARLCVAVLHMTHGSALGHPAPKKVWKSFVPDLVLSLLEVSQSQEALGITLQLVLGVQGGPQQQPPATATAAAAAATMTTAVAAAAAKGDTAPAAPAAATAVSELNRAAQQLLGAVLFHEAHIGALSELFFALQPSCGLEIETATAAGAVAAAPDAAAAGAGQTSLEVAAPSGRKASVVASAVVDAAANGSSSSLQDSKTLLPGFWEVVGRSYSGQLLQVLAAAIAGGNQTRSIGGCSTPGGTADAIILGLPWLLRTFCRAVARLRYTLMADASAGATGSG
ncbi:hypothetical protein VaNZ11_016576, partial [Volvox africanus]